MAYRPHLSCHSRPRGLLPAVRQPTAARKLSRRYAPSAYDSGESRRSQGISKAGNSLVRTVMIQTAWLWLRHQPDSALSQWFHRRTEGQSKRMRCVMIVALARKLAVALWRYLEHGLIPHGATLSAP